MPGLDSGHMENGTPALPVTPRQEGQAMEEVQEDAGC